MPLAHAADVVLERLREGNERFATGNAEHPRQSANRREQMAETQSPFAVVLTCVDSRVAPEMVFDQGMGDLLIVRVPGNYVDESVLAGVEFAVNIMKVPLVVVMGHSNCGAMQLTLADVTHMSEPVPGLRESRSFGIVFRKLSPAVRSTAHPSDEGHLRRATQANVANSLRALLAESFSLAEAARRGQTKFVGGYFDIASGVVEWL
ncbi:MAG: hypothetical protein KF812_03940 [Fimbriimonadaceae bacterium]|nr:hypothetical protein [Fimbriimonadaceae bacterium]